MTVTELRRRAVALGLGCLLLAPAAAFADAPTAQDRTLAESLFRDAKKLVAAKRYAEACPMLAESQRLDPGGGTLLNLATCHVAAGLTATAWGELSEALATAKRDGRANRVKAAQADIAALEPRLSRLTVVVAVDPSVPTEVDLDGKPLPTVAWGRPFPVDPGPHALKAHAPGRAPFEASVLVLANADQKKIDVPLLAPAVAAVPVVAVAAPPPVALVTPPPGPVTDAPAPPVETDHTARRTAGYVTGAVGVVGLGVGTYLALHAIALRSDSNQGCTPRVHGRGGVAEQRRDHVGESRERRLRRRDCRARGRDLPRGHVVHEGGARRRQGRGVDPAADRGTARVQRLVAGGVLGLFRVPHAQAAEPRAVTSAPAPRRRRRV